MVAQQQPSAATSHAGPSAQVTLSIKESQNRRAKRTRREDDAAGSSGQLLPQSQHPSHRQRQPGSERISSATNPTVENNVGDPPYHIQSNRPGDYRSHGSGNQSNPVASARNDSHTTPRQAHQQATARAVQDDPFFSDELYNGMLNGQPENNQVGRMYTRSQQQEIDQHYQRLMTPRPRLETGTNTPEAPMTPPQQFEQQQLPTVFVADLLNPQVLPQAGGAPRQNTPHNNTRGSARGGNAPPIAQVADRTPQPAEEQDDSLVVGDFTDWDPAWRAFINDHDCKPLIREHYPDEYR